MFLCMSGSGLAAFIGGLVDETFSSLECTFMAGATGSIEAALKETFV